MFHNVAALVERVRYPAVIKPTVLSASRGVIRVDDAISMATAFQRLKRLLGLKPQAAHARHGHRGAGADPVAGL